jgi:hypothetical protein
MNRDQRAAVLAALREVYDGHWIRRAGSEGGMSYVWRGRIVVIGAVTTAWDSAYAVVASMGDRFLLVRMDSRTGRVRSGRKAVGNAGDEKRMRAELADATAGLLAHINHQDTTPTDTETDTLVDLADLVTMARTAVIHDYRGDVIDAHAPEMPTRFAKQLTQVIRGALAVGMSRHHALELAIRCARDSVPPLRLSVLLDLAGHPGSTTHAVHTRLDRPRATVDRVLQALHILELATTDEVNELHGNKARTVWHYTMSDNVNRGILRLLGTARNVSSSPYPLEEAEEDDIDGARLYSPPNISGSTPDGAVCAACGAELTAEQAAASILCKTCLQTARADTDGAT